MFGSRERVTRSESLHVSWANDIRRERIYHSNGRRNWFAYLLAYFLWTRQKRARFMCTNLVRGAWVDDQLMKFILYHRIENNVIQIIQNRIQDSIQYQHRYLHHRHPTNPRDANTGICGHGAIPAWPREPR